MRVKGSLHRRTMRSRRSMSTPSDLIARTVMAQPGEIILIAIGPLTNVALAMLKEPRLARALGGLVIMGGVIGGSHALHLPWTEHNFRSDPEAAQIVLASGAPMAIVPLDVTTQVRMRTVGVARLAAADTPFHHRSSRPGPAVSAIQGAGLDLPARPAGGRVRDPAGADEVGVAARGGGNGRHVHGGQAVGEAAGRGLTSDGGGRAGGRGAGGRAFYPGQVSHLASCQQKTADNADVRRCLLGHLRQSAKSAVLFALSMRFTPAPRGWPGSGRRCRVSRSWPR